MHGKIVIDGHINDAETSITIHGETDKPDLEAVASLVMDTNNNIVVRDLLKMMLNYVEREIENDQRNYYKVCINDALKQKGLKPLENDVLEVVADEFLFQEASK